jgi:hypothetical protein
MAKAIQRRRGSTAEHASFTGLVGEITVDTTKKTAVVHDGSTAGGVPLAKESALPAASSTTVAGLVEKATDAEVRSATADKGLTTDLIESASALVALTDAAPVAVDWDAGINFSLTVTAAREIGNPTNGQPGTYRTILVQGNDATDRTITFGNQFLGTVPTITDCDTDRWYLLTIRCITSTHFAVSSQKVKGT